MTKKYLLGWAAIVAASVFALQLFVYFVVGRLYYPYPEPRHPEVTTDVADAPMMAVHVILYLLALSSIVFWLPFFMYGVTGKWLTHKIGEVVAYRWFIGVYAAAVLFNLYIVFRAAEPIPWAGIAMIFAVIITPLLLAAGNIVLLIALLVRRYRAKKNAETALETLPS